MFNSIEADALCDRLAIMARGKLRCIGKAAELKRRFGAGFTFTVSSSHQNSSETVPPFITAMFPSATILSEPIGGTFHYEVHRNDVRQFVFYMFSRFTFLSHFFHIAFTLLSHSIVPILFNSFFEDCSLTFVYLYIYMYLRVS